jgi:two-component system chemotaxis response regulator CheB
MFNHDMVMIGASAGGVETVSQLVKQLPSDLPAALFVVLHFPSQSVSVLPRILSRAGHLKAIHPQNGELIKHGQIYVAPPNYHLLIQHDRIYLNRGPRENGHRPAIDPLFRSAAHAYGQRAVGVILSGMLDDGTDGLKVIQAQGGVTIAQNPDEALFNGMPRSAIEQSNVAYVLNLADIAALITELAHTPVKERGMTDPKDNETPNSIEREREIVAQDKAALEQGKKSGTAST